VLSDDEYAVAVATAPNINGLQKKVEESIDKEELFQNLSSAATELPPPVKTESGGAIEAVTVPETKEAETVPPVDGRVEQK
jgi:Ser/Thr protein kinase RdoA (MazF antagonist)